MITMGNKVLMIWWDDNMGHIIVIPLYILWVSTMGHIYNYE